MCKYQCWALHIVDVQMGPIAWPSIAPIAIIKEIQQFLKNELQPRGRKASFHLNAILKIKNIASETDLNQPSPARPIVAPPIFMGYWSPVLISSKFDISMATLMLFTSRESSSKHFVGFTRLWGEIGSAWGAVTPVSRAFSVIPESRILISSPRSIYRLDLS